MGISDEKGSATGRITQDFMSKKTSNEKRTPGSLHPAGSTAPTRDVEIPAIQTVLNALKPLDYKARDRVMSYAISWCADLARKSAQ